jgi:hypothetical protein
MIDGTKILDAAEMFAIEYEFGKGEKDETSFRVRGEQGRFTVRLIADLPGFVVEVSEAPPEKINTIHDAVKKYILEAIGEPTSTPKSLRSTGKQDFSVEGWRQGQARSYNVAGKEAPNAFAVSEAANARGLSSQIIDSGRTKELAWGHVRVTDPKTGQFREDKVTHDKDIFCLLKSWEDARRQAGYIKDRSLIIGIDEVSHMPILDPEIKVKGDPAPLWLTLALMRAWTFADRDAITKAERRAQLKLLNQEWREDDEISLEQAEIEAVRGKRA